MNQNRISTLLVLSLLVISQSSALFLASANGQGGTINVFSNGSASVSISLTSQHLDTNVSIDVPRNVTFQSGQFMINARDEIATPGQVTLDIGQDGVNEWAFNGLGFGDLGHQNMFLNNATAQSLYSNGSAQSMPFYLPHNSVIDSGTMNITYTSDVPAGLIPIDDITAYESGDLDNDTLDEIVVKAQVIVQGGSAAPALASLDWNGLTGVTLSPWVVTCGAGADIVVADVNGDDYDDIISIAPGDDRVCFHQTNSTTGILGNASPVALSADLLSAKVGDFDADGYADIISIHEGGIVSLRTYNSKNSNFADNTTVAVFSNGTTMPAQLVSMFAGYFNGTGGEFSALVTDSSGHTNHVKWVNGAMALGVNSFDGIESEPIGADLDQDGDIDLFSSTMQGYILAENTGTTWTTTSVASAEVFINATIADHDGDGALSLLVPQLASGDGNSQTIEGNISVYNISTTSITSTQTTLEPWSCPKDSMFIDMDADGLLEHIVSAGEGTTFGLFIGSWNSIGMDIDRNGQEDLFAVGYAGDGQNGVPPLEFEDQLGLITTLLSPLTSGQMYTMHDYDINMNIFTLNFTSTGTGTFNISNIDIGYDIDFIVENNPAAVGNLTNIMNQQQTAGTGTISIDLPFLSTKTGTLSISSLYADYIPGAPNLALPPTPILSIDELSSERLVFSWQNTTDFGTDLIVFETFKVAAGGEFDLNNPTFSSTMNSTMDSDISAGDSYDYAVRSLHPYGVTSQLSLPLTVNVPFPAPPMPVQGLTVSDTGNDNGSSLNITWDASMDLISEYKIFVNPSEIFSLQELTPVSIITPFTGTFTTNITTDGNGNPLTDRTDYWVAVVAYDSYGNATSNFSLAGPVQSQNNSLRISEITFGISSSGFSNSSWFEISAMDSLDLSLTLSSEGEGIPSQNLALHFIGQSLSHSINGVTDENGVWQAVQVQDLTELSATFSEFVGEISLVAEYDGTIGTADIQPADLTAATLNGMGLLRATASVSSQTIQLNETNHYSIVTPVAPELPAQSSHLANVNYDWHLTDSSGNISDSGTIEIKGGELILEGTAVPGDSLTLIPSANQLWYSPTPNTIEFTFLSHQSNETGNETENETGNETNQPPFPDVTLAGTVSCQAVTYAWEENSTDSPLTCTVTNPNPFEVQLGFSWTVIPPTSPPLSFEHPSLTGPGPILTMNANETLEITFTPVRNGPSDGLFPGLQGVGYQLHLTCLDDGTGRCSGMTTSSATTEGELQWTLASQLEVDEPTDTNPTEPKSGSGALVGGIIAVLVIGGLGAAFVLLRPRPDDDDWFDEFDDEEDEDEPAPVTKPGRSLDEIKSEERDIQDEAPKERRPSLFDEIDGRGDIEEFDTDEEEFEEAEEAEEEVEAEAEDDGITVDEEGTEWWEDEEGVWWYREEGWEDWAVWED